MLPRRARLSREGFDQLQRARRLQSEHFSLSYRTDAQISGLAVVVSKKVTKTSVGRHLLKRRTRAILLPYAQPSLALVAHARPGAGGLTSAQIMEELKPLLDSIVPAPVA